MPLLFLSLLALAILLRPASGAQWTVGVYMCADNGMNDAADLDIAEMKQVGSTEEVNVVVQVDRAARDPRPNCYRYYIRKDVVDTLTDLGEVDMAAPATLSGFADFLRGHYPADNYLLVLWDHGNGWYQGYGPSRAIFVDESHTHEMGVAGGELAQAMAGVRQALGKRVRILAFDACLMGMVEVAAEVRDACDYVLASEALVPTDGLPYDELLDRITSRPTRSPVELLPDVCRDFVEHYPAEQVALSALDMDALSRALDLLAVATPQMGSSPESRAARAAARAMPGNSFHIDLIHFLDLLAAAGTDSLLAAFCSTVVANERSSGLENAFGLAVWFPNNYLALKHAAATYTTLVFARESDWLQFLNRYFAADDLKPTQPTVVRHRQGQRGDIQLWWNSSFDLAPVTYTLYEATRPDEAFNDYGDDLSNWIAFGWTTSAQQARSGQTSLFSGSASNLKNFVESADAVRLPPAGCFPSTPGTNAGRLGLSLRIRSGCLLRRMVAGPRYVARARFALWDSRSWHEPLPPPRPGVPFSGFAT